MFIQTADVLSTCYVQVLLGAGSTPKEAAGVACVIEKLTVSCQAFIF